MITRIGWVVLVCSVSALLPAQTIQVDISPTHVRKTFVPNQTLGAGIDRISQRAIDETFVKPVIDRVLAAGWGPVTYRQNTELYTEAWHWNPRGTGAMAAAKGISWATPHRRR
jgi:hypothetical protein